MKRILVGSALGLFVLGSAALAQQAALELPSGWHIAPVTPVNALVGTLPSAIVLSHDGARAFVLESGHRKPVLRVLDARSLATTKMIPLGNAFGVPLLDARGDGMWVANTSTFGEQLEHVNPLAGAVDAAVSLPPPFFPSALARSPDGTLLAVAGDQAARVAFVDLRGGAFYRGRSVMVGRHPAALAFAADGRTLYVADRGERTLDVIDVARNVVRTRIDVGLHPAAFAHDGRHLFVANADDDTIATIDMARNVVIAKASVGVRLGATVGASPNALLLDGSRLYVVCGAADAVRVFRVAATGRLTSLGAIPTGWYPTAVAVDHVTNTVLIADGKGEGGHANVNKSYVADNVTGAIRSVAIPSDADAASGLQIVNALGAPFARATLPPSTIVRAGGPIKHVIYIIKENRTYDQVLGDVSGADGDPSLVMFGRAITPNQHALVARFGVFDRFYCDAEVSADGHNWSMAAFANDYLEKMWPPNYDNRRAFYDFEDGAEASNPHAGYLWDAAARAHVSLRDYGEFVTAGGDDDNGNGNQPPVSTMERALQGRIDPRFAAFDLHIREQRRFEEWKREFDAYEATRTLPQLEIVRFGRDHTAGTKAGESTPQAMVADNDRAVGELVDAVSHSADWAGTAIFILEDDAQAGADHVDEQRSTFYLASPYAAGGLQHAHYTTSSVLRTIEMLLGMPPMTPYDSGARPLTDAFTATANLAPFDALPGQTDLDAQNAKTAYRASESARLDFAHADAVDPAILNDILWGATHFDKLSAGSDKPGAGSARGKTQPGIAGS